jgi:DNA-binding transcriptional MerR regulator
MKVGELAHRTGLSVRTLHHYDEIGLLRPERRTPSGHRIYGLRQVRRLQQIASLRQLGLSLDEIRDCLERPEYSLDRVLALQVERLRAEMDRQKRLVVLLEELRRRLSSGEDVSMDDITATIEASVHWERYYTPEQRAWLARRADEMGDERMRQSQRDWSALFDDFRSAKARGLTPDSPEVLALAARAHELIEAFTGGDEGIRASLSHMYQEEPGTGVMERHGMAMDPGLWSYYGKALEAYRDGRREAE